MTSISEAFEAEYGKERKISLNEIKQTYPNDYDLGDYFRINFQLIDNIDHDVAKQIIKENPNDDILGEVVRHQLKEN